MHSPWTKEEINTLKKNYGKKPVSEIMDLIPGRCYDGVRSKAKRLNLTKKK